MSSTITFTDRELAVARIVLNDYKPVDVKGISAEDWEKIGHLAGVDNGQIGRNAKFALNSLLGKIKGDKGKVKRGCDDGEDGEGAAAAATAKKAKRGTAKPAKAKGGAKGGKSKVKVEDHAEDEDGADAADVADAAEGASV